ncbi:translation initiation factor IF-2 [Thermoclostridium stercorarium subsp. stercorarium DSM 8532]|uniref:Translation initiation factor IF-2 n=3 Tax=Thermoclostridium stercorarium TaxID=1510 RepID=L7VJ33_THES1|nr:translation initiation factor IF-2 [Thermoclostridium stercorarium]AGC68085.1 translation initiation factor IF-2 [Thermoclostridium stercorarium subsp. stercorarium DSM 8532]AGI39111.1 translation initiation factor-2 [Thermoclostridium stercorarium subsp. stercorarium DSM 8532]ANW98470.1 translation initiation factor IF-2 [Thermoclostridium stercorarium subsp. thermolacticum DSM 2910]UZQ86612.1 translation initiation factor IF-2 [Thermoclostridium stercorarium]
MSKRVFELAKELNTTSKRLMEKLEEINIKVKSHMSLLDDEQLERLYEHIGVVNRDRISGSDEGSSTERTDQPEQPGSQLVRRTIPRIIRKTEIIIHDENEENDVNKDKQQNKKGTRSYVRTSSSTDGLRAGLKREEDVLITSIRKHKAEQEETKKTEVASKQSTSAEEKGNEETKAAHTVSENAPDDGQKTERTIRRPVDSILSIKKVSSKKEWERRKAGETDKAEDKAAVASAEQKEQTVETVAEDKKADNIKTEKEIITESNQKEAISAGAEQKEGHMQAGTFKDMKKTGKEETKELKSEKKAVAEKEQVSAEGAGKAETVTGEAAVKAGKEERKDIPGQVSVQARDAEKDKDKKVESVKNTEKDGMKVQDKAKNKKHHKHGDKQAESAARDGKEKKHDFAEKQKGTNKNLVIPKAAVAPGQPEEKNNLRSERRSSTIRDLEKGIKREAKKEKEESKRDIKSALGAGIKGKTKYKKHIHVGHMASVSDMYSDDYILEEFYEEKIKVKKEKTKKKEKEVPQKQEKEVAQKPAVTEVTIPETITVKSFAETIKKSVAEVIKKLMSLGVMATMNQEIDFDTAAIVGEEFGIKVNKEAVVNIEDILFDDDEEDKEEELVERAPVVVVMGHVDHGKTSLLDAIRKTNVASREAGGITQHIGAYKVNVNGRSITFLDTPGHEAFTAMRARGAQATDIAILVVAADDGVMPQTIEAINHAKAANVSIVVAINKMDKPEANPEKVKQQLAEHGLLVEEWGGDIVAVPVSAKTGQNIDLLLEMVLLTADMLELKANPNRRAKGIIIEAKLDKGRGPVATVLIQRGTLHTGDAVISGTAFGHVRAMVDENGNRVDAAGPSTPVEIIGLDEVPEAGEVLYAVADEKLAKELVEKRRAEQREKAIGSAKPVVSLEDLFNRIQQGDMKELNLIVKADVQGSVEALKQSFEKLSNDEVKVQVIHGGVGTINEADVTLASVSHAIIIGFNVRPPQNVVEAAKDAGVDIRLYRVIYDAINDVEKAMKGLLEPEYKEVVDGHVEIRKIFKVSSVGTIGGGYVLDGKISRNSDVRVVRNGIVVYEGKLASLKRFKDDVREVTQGYECGLLIDKFNDIKEGDIIEAFRMVEVERV